ncbi:MAG TPA: glycogen debranching N-terminal domain-containing protein, partial [Burkholderiales bacterium]|nr:glycogen debranching N-terminal domain-containing protein [Burkholderiales bacterium]
MKREGPGLAPTVVVPGVVSLAASSRRTLKHGDTFAMFDELGDVVEMEHSPAGLFHCDTRHLSRLLFTLEGHRPLSLSSTVQPDNVVLDVDLTNPDFFREGELVLAKDTFHVARAKFLWQAGCHELFTVSSYAERPRRVRVALEFDADFADLFEIRGYPRRRRGEVQCARRGPAQVEFSYGSLDCVARSTRLCFSPAPTALGDSRAEFELELAPRERRALALTVTCRHGPPPPAPPRFFTAMRRARGEAAQARERMPSVETSSAPFNGVVSRSSADLAMLMTETAQGGYPYAGVPWFSTVFGRDGLVTALETLWLDASIARGVLRFLAAHQGSRQNPQADEEPGKIVHEMRESELARIGAVPFGRYFGSVDATPLFVALAGLYWKRSCDRETLEEIWPAVKAALGWIDCDGDRDRDGFVEYDRRRSSGLRNQGWKDSDDAVFHADGRLAEGPIALCEVQGYVYLAKRLAAELAADLDEPQLCAHLQAEAGQLKERFEAAFWCESLGTYALALDGDKSPCCVRSSNAGQLLFTG